MRAPGIGIGFCRRSVGYSPLDALGAALLYAWYDADPATLFTDTAGTVPAVFTNTIGRWADKSGNGNHQTQASGAQRPTYASPGVLTFGGTHRLLCLDFTQATKAQQFTIVSVGTNKLDGTMETDVNTPRSLLSRSTSTSVGMHAGATYTPAGAPDLNERRIKTGIFNGANSIVKVNGVTVGTVGNAGTNGMIGAASGGSISNFLVTGSGTTPLGKAEGLCEQLFIGGALSAAQEADLYAYLTAKWLT
jgi:hypothetical protein